MEANEVYIRLDKIINEIKNGNRGTFKGICIDNSLLNSGYTDYKFVDEYRAELVDRGFISKINGAEDSYQITVKGIAFKGYSQTYQDAHLDRQIAQRNENLLRRYSFWTAFAACSVLLMEIIKFFFPPK